MKTKEYYNELVDNTSMYILMNGYEEVASEMYECPGGHIWHYSDIEELVLNMSIAELEELKQDWIFENN